MESPNTGIEPRRAPKRLVTAQALFPLFVATNLRTLRRDLLSVDDQKALLMSPTEGLLGLSALVAMSGEMANLVVHDQLHGFEARLPHQLADALLLHGGDLGESQVQLQLPLPACGLLLKSAERILAVDLILFLHSDSPISKQMLLRVYGPGAESRYVLRAAGHPLPCNRKQQPVAMSAAGSAC